MEFTQFSNTGTITGGIGLTKVGTALNVDASQTQITSIGSLSSLTLNGTNVTATAAELNILDGNTSASSTTIINDDTLIINDGGVMKQVAVTDILDFVHSNTGINSLSDTLIETNSMYLGHDPSGTTDTANYNVGVGISSLSSITIGDSNTSIGYEASKNTTIANECVSIGFKSLYSNTAGSNNVAIGRESSYMCGATGSGKHNVSIGSNSLRENISSDSNVGIGYDAGKNITGEQNIAIGKSSGATLTTGSNNVVIGYNANVSASGATNQIVVGQGSTGQGDNQISLGNTSITHIKAQVTSITAYSDRRIKKDIVDCGLGLNFIVNLRPVSFKRVNPADYPIEILEDRYKGENPDKRPSEDSEVYDGLIAQEVKDTLNNLNLKWSGHSINESDGKHSIQYGGLTIPLINAVKELSDKNNTLENNNNVLEGKVNVLEGKVNVLEEQNNLLLIKLYNVINRLNVLENKH